MQAPVFAKVCLCAILIYLRRRRLWPAKATHQLLKSNRELPGEEYCVAWVCNVAQKVKPSVSWALVMLFNTWFTILSYELRQRWTVAIIYNTLNHQEKSHSRKQVVLDPTETVWKHGSMLHQRAYWKPGNQTNLPGSCFICSGRCV